MKNYRAYYYGQIIHGLEYNPRLFLYLLILVGMFVFSYQFAAQLTSSWIVGAFATLGMVAVMAMLVWPYQAVFLFLGFSIWYHAFVRGQTVVGLGSALVYPGDAFVGAFLVLEFFRGCMRQTHLYTATDRWMLAFFAWSLICVGRGVMSHGYSAIGESREFMQIIAYFVAIHYITRPEQLKSVLKWLKWICIITSLYAFYMVIANGFRPRYPGGNPLHLIAQLNIVVLGVLLGRDHIKRHRLLWSLVLLVMILLAFYSAMRAITVSMVATLPFLLWITRRHFIKAMALVAVGVVAAMGLLAILNPIYGGELIPALAKLYRGIINPTEDPTGSWRLYGWQWELEKIFSNPFWVIIGQGFGGYYQWFFGLMDESIRAPVHNQYIQMWSKMGLVSLALYAGILFTFYRDAFRFLQKSRDEFQRSVMMIIMLMVLGCQVNHMGGGIVVGLWVIMALGTALPRLWLLENPTPPVILATLPGRAKSHHPVGRWRPGLRSSVSSSPRS